MSDDLTIARKLKKIAIIFFSYCKHSVSGVAILKHMYYYFNFARVDVVLKEGGVGRSSPPTDRGDGGANGEGEGGGETGAEGEDKGQQRQQVPDYKTQKTEIHAALQHRLKQGDTWSAKYT